MLSHDPDVIIMFLLGLYWLKPLLNFFHIHCFQIQPQRKVFGRNLLLGGNKAFVLGDKTRSKLHELAG